MRKPPSSEAARDRAGKPNTHQLAEMWLALSASPHPTEAWESFIHALLDCMGVGNNRP